jgi:ribosomal protein L37AE/L43A
MSLEKIASGMADRMSTDRLMQELEKTTRDDMKQLIEEEISKRTKCPECGNTLMKNERDNLMYCPVGHYERKDYE